MTAEQTRERIIALVTENGPQTIPDLMAAGLTYSQASARTGLRDEDPVQWRDGAYRLVDGGAA